MTFGGRIKNNNYGNKENQRFFKLDETLEKRKSLKSLNKGKTELELYAGRYRRTQIILKMNCYERFEN